MAKETKDILGFDDRWLLLFGIPVVAVIMTLLMFGDSVENQPMSFISKCSLISVFYVTIYWLFFRWIIINLRKIFPLHRDILKRLGIQVLIVTVAYFLLKIVLHAVIDESIHDAFHVNKPHDFTMGIASLVVTSMVLAVYESIFFYNQLQNSILERERLERANIHSQLEGLKNQVNPHFLFNSLNTLATIIPEDPEQSVRFVQKLAEVYRYILEMRDKKIIPLSEELAFLNSYVFLLKERFEENLEIVIEIPEANENDQIIPLSLQILIENAIKHNIISTHRPLKIRLFIENGNRLVVRNNLQRKNQAIQSTGFGLKNIKNRYAFFSERLVEVIVSTNAFIVSLPLLKVGDPSHIRLISE